LTIYYIPNISV